MKKRTVALLLALVLVFGIAVGGTVAWLTSKTDTVTNTFTTGNVKITLDEDDPNNDDPNVRTKENEYKIMPGQTVDKDPTVHVASTSESCYIYVTVANGMAEYEVADGNDATITEQMEDNGWKVLTGAKVDGVQVWYKEAAVAANTNHVVFEHFTVKNEAAFSNDDLKGKDIVVNAYAIQSAEMDSAIDAWNTGRGDDWGTTTPATDAAD